MEDYENQDHGAEKEPFVPDRERYTVVDVRFRSGGKSYFFDPGSLTLAAGENVIIDTARGPEFGICVTGNHEIPASEMVAALRSIIRRATEADCRTAVENREKEKRAMSVCQQKISDLGLDMQLVSAEYAFDGSKILFFFTADGRVDFRDLVKSLASVFRTRIELRQIGVRDKAKMVGGLGVCGRPFCCREFLPDFQPVSIKMAKTQSLSLNPAKISGTCGRLMCCLKYEQDTYEELQRTAPKLESFVDTPDGRGTVTDVNLLTESVRVRLEKDPDTVNTYRDEDICILRSGKPRKNDAPIPDELAPISGNGVRRKKPQPEAPEQLAPVILRSEAINTPVAALLQTDEPPEPQDIPETQDEPETVEETVQQPRNSSRRRRRKPSGSTQQSQNTQQAAVSQQNQQNRPKQQSRPADQAQFADNSQKSGDVQQHSNRNRNRRRRPRKPQEQGGAQGNSQE